MPDGVHYDGDYTTRTQVGGAVPEDLLLTNSKLYHVPYHQLLANFLSAVPTWATVGETGTAWENLPVVDISPLTDLGGGLVAFTLTYATVPASRTETELFTYEYQFLYTGELKSISLNVHSTITYSYYHTATPATAISLAHAYRLSPLVGHTYIYSGTAPASDATSFLGEDESFERWKGLIWVKKRRTVPTVTPGTLA